MFLSISSSQMPDSAELSHQGSLGRDCRVAGNIDGSGVMSDAEQEPGYSKLPILKLLDLITLIWHMFASPTRDIHKWNPRPCSCAALSRTDSSVNIYLFYVWTNYPDTLDPSLEFMTAVYAAGTVKY